MSAARSTMNQEKKTKIVYGVFGALLLIFGVYAYTAFFSDGPAPARPAAAPVTVAAPVATTAKSANAANAPGLSAAPGIAAKKMASTSSSLDPTLDEAAMLRTESLVYSGTGRNIFSATYTPPPPPAIFSKPPPARLNAVAPPVQTGPPPTPPPPPINLKFFGTAVRGGGARQAFLLSGEDVYLASQNDIVARKYKIMQINATSVQVQDLTNNNTQTLQLQQN